MSLIRRILVVCVPAAPSDKEELVDLAVAGVLRGRLRFSI